jgi:Tfp pilus assembly protein FimT
MRVFVRLHTTRIDPDPNRAMAVAAFTMVELLLVLIILGTFALIAVPRYATFLADQRIDAAARRLAADIAYAQRAARMASSARTVSFNVSGDSYTLVGIADPDRAGTDYTVALGSEPYGTSIKLVNLDGDTEIVFDGYGVPDSGGAIALKLGALSRTLAIHAETGRVTITNIDTVEALPEELPKQPPILEV